MQRVSSWSRVGLVGPHTRGTENFQRCRANIASYSGRSEVASDTIILFSLRDLVEQYGEEQG
jgi:hypothetical protein